MKARALAIATAALVAASACSNAPSPAVAHVPRAFPTPAGAHVPTARPVTPNMPTFVGVPEVAKLPNGVTVKVYPDASLPLVSMAFVLDHPGVPGDSYTLRWLFSRAVLGGSENHSADEARGNLAYFAAYPRVTLNEDGMVWSIDTIGDIWKSAFREVAMMLSTPTFDREGIENAATACTFAHRRLQGGDAVVAELRRKTFGSVHPSIPPDFVPCRTLHHDALLAYRDRVLAPSTLTVVVAGDVSLAEVVAEATDDFPGFVDHGTKPGSRPARAPEAAPPTFSGVPFDTGQQAHVRMAFPGVGFTHRDLPVLSVLAEILGAGLTGRLDSKLRNEQGSTYGFHVSAEVGRTEGSVFVAGAVAKEDAVSALASLTKELERVRSEPVSPAELALGKKLALGEISRAYETPGAAARDVAGLVLLGAPHRGALAQGILTTTAEDVRRVAATYLDRQKAHVVVGADRETLERIRVARETAP